METFTVQLLHFRDRIDDSDRIFFGIRSQGDLDWMEHRVNDFSSVPDQVHFAN